LPRTIEKKAAEKSSVPRLPMRKERWANSSGSTIGRGWLRLRAIIATSSAAPAAKAASVPAAVQPQSLPSTMPSVISASESASISAPGRSGRRLSRGGRAARRRLPAQTIAAPSGRLTRKTSRQSPSSTRAPPRVGPVAAAAAAAAPQRPTPVARFSTGKLSSTIANEAGMISAAATPCRTRKAISSSRLGASAQSRLAAVKPATPSRKIRLWPKRSARPPAGTSSAAITTK
jgi:hypothetical protein